MILLILLLIALAPDYGAEELQKDKKKWKELMKDDYK